MGVVHACPATGVLFTPCCHRTVFELSALDQMTVTSWLVTCRVPVSSWPRSPSGRALVA